MNFYNDKTPQSKKQTSQYTVQKKNKTKAPFSSSATAVQMQLQEMASNSLQVKQAMQLQTIANANFSLPIQKQDVEEEELQMKAIPVQKQGIEEEELQMKAIPIQKQGIEEEELQMKAIPIQKQGIEEEELQMKAITVQKQDIEEEELQMKAIPIQKQSIEEEHLQGRFDLPLQKKENNTGLPDNLKSGIENLSGYSMDDVKVHYNSDKPAQLQAHAYAQGTDIHIASGQEKHLPHEAWHVVQQKQGRVQPTLQMKGNVNVNDDAGLENEADVMGAKALQASAFQTPLQAKAKISGPVAQLVLEKSKRPAHDQRMNDLKEEAVAILNNMRELGVDWETKYGQKGKEKGSTIFSGEKTDYKAEIRRAALKKYWESLTQKEKSEMIGYGAKLGLKGLGLAGKGGKKLAGLALEGSGKKEKEKPIEEEKPDETSSSNWLSELTSDDVQNIYEVYSKIGELQEKYEEAKEMIQKKMGKLGESVGSVVGDLRNEASFNKRMKALRQGFMIARTKYELLDKAIKDNDDHSRFKDELEALYRGIMYTPKGPAMVYNGGELNKEGRKLHPELCLQSIIEIQVASRNIDIDEYPGHIAKKAMNFISPVLDFIPWKSGKEASEELIDAKKLLTVELNGVLNKSWSAHTRWVSTPSGVKAIKTAILDENTDDDKLKKAKALAKVAYSTKSSNRSLETQIFYDALAKLNEDDLSSLKLTQSIIASVGTRLD
ncbi:DUF4157 domain-containing protein [Flavobacterium procerum]|uniref:DUF4157 domain-containing protein n=1 Tax=Flavobacterium procerum TaxID=1455569 RepID=A0ABV6BXY2_9FLAO